MKDVRRDYPLQPGAANAAPLDKHHVKQRKRACAS